MEKTVSVSERQALEGVMTSLSWYHTIDLGHGLVTPGQYDHRPYLSYYGLPKNLRQSTALDIGAASGYFAFMMEKRGADVTATDLPTWEAHDFGPLYQPDMEPEQAQHYLHDPFLFAHKALGSRVKRRLTNIYEISPESTGRFDLVFCGSVLLHLTDPIRALWGIQSVTKKAAIIATVIHPLKSPDPLAKFVGELRGDGWWYPNRAALEAMIKSAGFKGWEWFSEFRLDYRDGSPGPYHGVIRAWNTNEKPDLLADTDLPAADSGQPMIVEDPEIERLRNLVRGFEKMRCVRLAQWLNKWRNKVAK
jgi:tRNA (mo5U34)-methyltransferase